MRIIYYLQHLKYAAKNIKQHESERYELLFNNFLLILIFPIKERRRKFI